LDFQKTAKNVLNAILANPKISIREIAQDLDVAVSTVQNSISALKKSGLLVKTGETSAREWHIVEEGVSRKNDA